MAKIEWKSKTVKLGDLKPWDQNPRQSTKKQQDAIKASFEDFGQVQTVAIGPDGDVLDGHQRLSALLNAHGPDYTIEARQASRALTEKERKRLVVMLHTGATGSWDWDALSGWDAKDLLGWGMDADALKEWKSDVSALSALIDSEEKPPVDAEPQIDQAAELNKKWGVIAGDLWMIGEHRLLCGDSTKREDVDRVMQGEKADLCLTDPPYGLGEKKKSGKND